MPAESGRDDECNKVTQQWWSFSICYGWAKSDLRCLHSQQLALLLTVPNSPTMVLTNQRRENRSYLLKRSICFPKTLALCLFQARLLKT